MQQQQQAVSTTVNDGQFSSSDAVHPDSSAVDDDGTLAAVAAMAMENHQLALFDVILSVSHSHTAHCDVTEDKVLHIVQREASLVTELFNSIHNKLSKIIIYNSL